MTANCGGTVEPPMGLSAPRGVSLEWPHGCGGMSRSGNALVLVNSETFSVSLTSISNDANESFVNWDGPTFLQKRTRVWARNANSSDTVGGREKGHDPESQQSRQS